VRPHEDLDFVAEELATVFISIPVRVLPYIHVQHILFLWFLHAILLDITIFINYVKALQVIYHTHESFRYAEAVRQGQSVAKVQ
jgi:hypothetical protein